MKSRVKNTVVFNASQGDFGSRRLTQPYAELVAKYFSDEYGNVEMIVADQLPSSEDQETRVIILQFKDCNIANLVKQTYNGRLLFEILVYTNFIDMCQYNATGLLCVEFADNPHLPSKKRKKSKGVEFKQRIWLVKQRLLHEDDDDSFLYPHDFNIMEKSHQEEGGTGGDSIQYDNVFYDLESAETDYNSSTHHEAQYSRWQEVESSSYIRGSTRKRHYSSSSATSAQSRSHDTGKSVEGLPVSRGLSVLHPSMVLDDNRKTRNIERKRECVERYKKSDSDRCRRYRSRSRSRSRSRRHRRSRWQSRERYTSRSTSNDRRRHAGYRRRSRYDYSSSSDESVSRSSQEPTVTKEQHCSVTGSGWSNEECRSRSGTPVMDELSSKPSVITEQQICTQQSPPPDPSSMCTIVSSSSREMLHPLPLPSSSSSSSSSSEVLTVPVSLPQVSHNQTMTIEDKTMIDEAAPNKESSSSSSCDATTQIPVIGQVVSETDANLCDSLIGKKTRELLQELESSPPSPLSDKKVTVNEVSFNFHKSQILQEYECSADALVAASEVLASHDPQHTESIRHNLLLSLMDIGRKLLKKFRDQTGIIEH